MRLRGDCPASGRDDPALGEMTQFRLDGQVALVTGATGGLGSAMCRAFAAAGARVALADLPDRAGAAQELGKALETEHGVRTAVVTLDVTDVRGIDAAVAHRFGRESRSAARP